MKLSQIYELAVDNAVKIDPRGPAEIKRLLSLKKKEYDDLPKDQKYKFDPDELWNPYPDTRIQFMVEPEKDIKTMLVGIDCETPELLLADQLNQRGQKIDLVLGHHPAGKAFADLHNVMDMLDEIYAAAGVPIHIAQNINLGRVSEVGRSVHAFNSFRAVDAGKLLNLNFATFHTATDNLVFNYLQNLFIRQKPKLVADVLDILEKIPEYRQAAIRKTGPALINGRKENFAGRVHVDMTGGTSPGKEAYQELSRAGVSTVIGMHMTEDSIKMAKKNHLNVVIAGHISSDSLGLNLFVDELAKKIKGLDIIPCSGFIRVSRLK